MYKSRLVSTYQDKHGTWYLRVRVAGLTGKRRVSLSTTNESDADRLAIQYEQRLALVEQGVLEEVEDTSTQSIEEITTAFLTHVAKTKSPTTYSTYRYGIGHVLGEMGATLVSQLTGSKYATWLSKRREKGTAESSLLTYYRCTQSMFTWAVKNKLIKDHPMTHWEPPKNQGTNKRRDLTLPQLQKLLEVSTIEDRTRWATYVYTGLRGMTVARMEWHWIDWENKIITIPAKYSIAKGAKGHQIRIHPDLETMLTHWRGMCTTAPYVFPQVNYSALWYRFKNYLNDAGIDPTGVSIHSLRHTFGTMIFQATKDLKLCQKLLNHSDIKTTAKYLHSDLAAEEAGMAALDTISVLNPTEQKEETA